MQGKRKQEEEQGTFDNNKEGDEESNFMTFENNLSLLTQHLLPPLCREKENERKKARRMMKLNNREPLMITKKVIKNEFFKFIILQKMYNITFTI